MPRLTRRQFLVRSGLTAAALTTAGPALLSGCQRKAKGGLSRQLRPFAMQAAWVNDAEFTGYFLAIDRGYYREDGLDLTYLPGGPEVIPEGTLLANKADLALTTPDTTVNLILKEGAALRIIGTQYQKSPLGVVSLRSSAIEEPKDLLGRTLAVPPVNVLSVEAMLKINGIPQDSVQIVPYQYDPTPLVEGRVDATIDFVTNVPFTIESQGVEVNSFLLYDWGFTIYNDTVVVTDATLRERREDLVGWLRASRRGWQENNQDPTLYPPQFAETWFRGNGRSIDNEVYFNQAQKPLIDHPNGVFSMDPEDIEANIRALKQIGLEASRDMFVTDLLDEI